MMPDILTLVGSRRAASYPRALAHAARAAWASARL